MKRDICHYYEADLQSVYNAYAKVASEKFGKNCKYHNGFKLSFHLNFTFIYNMNGGSCTIHFMPYNSGTAVNVRYSIVQLFGARYGAYDDALTKNVVEILGVEGTALSVDPGRFEAYAASHSEEAEKSEPQNMATPKAQPEAQESNDIVEEIRKYKALLDDGIITPEEFAAKKKQILGL